MKLLSSIRAPHVGGAADDGGAAAAAAAKPVGRDGKEAKVANYGQEEVAPRTGDATVAFDPKDDEVVCISCRAHGALSTWPSYGQAKRHTCLTGAPFYTINPNKVGYNCIVQYSQLAIVRSDKIKRLDSAAAKLTAVAVPEAQAASKAPATANAPLPPASANAQVPPAASPAPAAAPAAPLAAVLQPKESAPVEAPKPAPQASDQKHSDGKGPDSELKLMLRDLHAAIAKLSSDQASLRHELRAEFATELAKVKPQYAAVAAAAAAQPAVAQRGAARAASAAPAAAKRGNGAGKSAKWKVAAHPHRIYISDGQTNKCPHCEFTTDKRASWLKHVNNRSFHCFWFLSDSFLFATYGMRRCYGYTCHKDHGQKCIGCMNLFWNLGKHAPKCAHQAVPGKQSAEFKERAAEAYHSAPPEMRQCAHSYAPPDEVMKTANPHFSMVTKTFWDMAPAHRLGASPLAKPTVFKHFRGGKDERAPDPDAISSDEAASSDDESDISLTPPKASAAVGGSAAAETAAARKAQLKERYNHGRYNQYSILDEFDSEPAPSPAASPAKPERKERAGAPAALQCHYCKDMCSDSNFAVKLGCGHPVHRQCLVHMECRHCNVRSTVDKIAANLDDPLRSEVRTAVAGNIAAATIKPPPVRRSKSPHRSSAAAAAAVGAPAASAAAAGGPPPSMSRERMWTIVSEGSDEPCPAELTAKQLWNMLRLVTKDK